MNCLKTAFVLGLSLAAFCLPIHAQIHLSLSDATSVAPGIATVTASVTNSEGPVQGWSYGLCHDNNVIRPLESYMATDMLTVNAGETPDYFFTSVGNDGVQNFCVFDFFGATTLPIGGSVDLMVVEYSTFGPLSTVSQVDFCSTVGNPPAEQKFSVNYLAIIPTSTSGNVTIGVVDPNPPIYTDPVSEPEDGLFTFRVLPTVATVQYDPLDGIFSVGTQIEVQANQNIAGDIQARGFDIEASYDPALVSLVSATPGSNLSSFVNPDVFMVTDVAGVISIDVVYDSNGIITDPINSLFGSLVDCQYDSVPAAFVGQMTSMSLGFSTNGAVNTIDAVDSMGVDVLIMAFGDSTNIQALALGGPGSGNFIRGDANNDSSVDIGDTIAVLDALFGGGVLSCLIAGDANNDDQLNIADAISLLSFLFSGGNAPSEPFPACGPNPTAPVLSCMSNAACP